MRKGCKRWTALCLALVLSVSSVMSVSAAEGDAPGEADLIVEGCDTAVEASSEDSEMDADMIVDGSEDSEDSEASEDAQISSERTDADPETETENGETGGGSMRRMTQTHCLRPLPLS